jgi:gamma-glutamyl:cysteine ligase YbdK (ATP-grasp superfamily)
MSMADAEKFIRNAEKQYAQHDINASLLKATVELTREVKRISDDIQRARRQASRRF